MRSLFLFVLLAHAALIIAPAPAFAYIGPGAGFAFLGSGFVFILTIFLAIATFAFWPIQWAWRKLKRQGISSKARARRVVILGLDGLEPSLLDKYMEEGKLPHLKSLKDEGCYHRLGTTLPALSPVAWSTFQTGVNPGAHNIFDFLTRDKRTCLPELSSTETHSIKTKFLRSKKSQIRITRKSKPFWNILGERGIFSNIIRVPISYPPEKFGGNILSAMCTPDLRGTQGTFSLFTSKNSENNGSQTTGGERQQLTPSTHGFKGQLIGPPKPAGKENYSVEFEIVPKKESQEAVLKLNGKEHLLKLDSFSDWIEVPFKVSFSKNISGIARFCLRQLEPTIELYVSPINANPEKPALPISHPFYFCTWLAKKLGVFGTLGLMEDTWGRNEKALNDAQFLEQAYATHSERERMWFEALEKTQEGVCACVFDASDRIQHMFWRYLDPKHPSPLEDQSFASTIPQMYERMDVLVGETIKKLKSNDLFIVLSDHGFASFRRCINLNSWLIKEGYMKLKDGKTVGADYFKDVDWAQTKAFAVGLSGLYLNLKGREHQGIVDPAEAPQLKGELCKKLETLCDPQDNSKVIRKVYDTAKVYRGLYAQEAPDLITGYFPGFRVSWDSVTGAAEANIFSDNVKAWSGDHHVDPELIPGIFLSNRKIKTNSPHIRDIAPTVLDTFAVKVPAYMEGKVLC